MMPAVMKPEEMVKTQAEQVPPPDVTVPESGATSVDPAILADVKSLADRVGGLQKLRDLVDSLTNARG
jgi:hypothetical protein